MRTQSRSSLLLAAAAAALVGAAPAMGVASEQAARAEMAREAIVAASAFQGYVQRASSLRGEFADGQAVADALAVGATYEIGQIEQGEIAFGALVALQDPAFIRGVRRAAPDEAARRRMVDDLIANPRNVLTLQGSESAAALVKAALRANGEELARAGRSVKQAAYDVQRQPWSRQTVPNAPARLARVKALSRTGYTPSAEDEARLLRAAVEMRGTVPTRSYAVTNVVAKSLALAAVALAGEAGDENAARLQPLLGDASANTCLKMAKLNLYQCLAVSGPHYEDVFCLGVHALMDTGKCVSGAAGPALEVPVERPPSATFAASSVPVASD